MEEDINHIPHPSDSSQKVHWLLDACHMLKLMRNLLGEKNRLIANTGAEIKCELLKELATLQKEEGLSAGSSLKDQHINYSQQKMKVSLEAKTLSNSVANALT